MWITGSVLTSGSQTQVRSVPPGHWRKVLRQLSCPDTGHSGTFKSNKCDFPILLTIKQILFTEAYQRLMKIMNPPQIVPIWRFPLRDEDSKQLL